jgi:starch synthase
LRCLFAASEVAGFAKTGGLADVAASLPRALTERGVECAVILPLYNSAKKLATAPSGGGQAVSRPEPTGLTFTVPMGHKLVHAALWRSSLLPQKSGGKPIPVFLVEQPDYYERDDPQRGRGLYQYEKRGDPFTTLPSPLTPAPPSASLKVDYPDNCERFGFFCRAILEAVRLFDYWPDILHINDWQTGLVPVYLREIYPQIAGPLRARYAQIRTLCTIHNLAYQGNFWHLDMPLLGLPWRLFNFEHLEFYNHISFLKAGLVFSDLLTTVSPMYAREIQTPYFGCGLQGVLLQRSAKLHGIVNGADYDVWNPQNDTYIAARYDDQTVTQGKTACKSALQKLLGLDENPRAPLLGMVSRLVDQKGLDLLVKAAPDLLREGAQLVVLGEGHPHYHQALERLGGDFPRQMAAIFAHDEKRAHQIEAGADIFLMPSQYEPCGLSQLYSLKYGTVPVVRATGGLADTVADATSARRPLSPEGRGEGAATGFAFVVYSAPAFLEAVRRAIAMYRDQPGQWLELQRAGMRQDWSWNRSAAEYERLYRSLMGA